MRSVPIIDGIVVAEEYQYVLMEVGVLQIAQKE